MSRNCRACRRRVKWNQIRFAGKFAAMPQHYLGKRDKTTVDVPERLLAEYRAKANEMDIPLGMYIVMQAEIGHGRPVPDYITETIERKAVKRREKAEQDAARRAREAARKKDEENKRRQGTLVLGEAS